MRKWWKISVRLGKLLSPCSVIEEAAAGITRCQNQIHCRLILSRRVFVRIRVLEPRSFQRSTSKGGGTCVPSGSQTTCMKEVPSWHQQSSERFSDSFVFAAYLVGCGPLPTNVAAHGTAELPTSSLMEMMYYPLTFSDVASETQITRLDTPWIVRRGHGSGELLLMLWKLSVCTRLDRDLTKGCR